MDKFIFITDSHHQGKNLDSRTDNYSDALFGKLDFVVDFCKKHGVKNVVHGGDLLNSPNISDLVAGKIAKVFRKNKLHLWYTIGNHDITGKNPETYVNGKLHMFESYHWFHFIGGKPHKFENCVLMGVDYNWEDENNTDFYMKEFDGCKKYKILVLHAMIYGKKHDMMVGSKRIVISYRSINTNADLVLCGHYHPGMKTKRLEVLNKTILFANPGSFGRTDCLTNKIGVGPGMTYVKVSKDGIRLKHIPIPCDRTVFVGKAEGKYELSDITGAKFYKALCKFKNFQVAKNDIGMMLKAMASMDNKAIPFEIDDRIIAFIVTKAREVENGHKHNNDKSRI